MLRTWSEHTEPLRAQREALQRVALRPGRSRRFRGFQPAGTVGLASGESAREVAGQLRRDFWPTLALEWVAQLVESAILAVPQLTTMASSGGLANSNRAAAPLRAPNWVLETMWNPNPHPGYVGAARYRKLRPGARATPAPAGKQ